MCARRRIAPSGGLRYPASIRAREDEALAPQRDPGAETYVTTRLLAFLLLIGSGTAPAATSGLFSAQMPRLLTPEQQVQIEFESYTRDVLRRIVANQFYPREALSHALQGAARVDLVIGADGRVKGVRLLRSTGHAILDTEALEKVRRVGDLPVPPRALRGREFSLAVPVVFRIEE